MVQCPSCKAQIDDAFGMLTCRSCGVILFVDMEGQAYLNTTPSVSDEPVQAEITLDEPGYNMSESLQTEAPVDRRPVDISEFANSERSQARDGPLLFRLKVGGIDSKELRESVLEAVSDSRFQWSAAEVMAGISMGELVIDGVSPVKASVLVSRLKRLPVQIKWEQYAITQAETTPI